MLLLERAAYTLGMVEAIHIAASKRAPLESLDEVKAIAGEGLEGDRYFGRKPDSQVTIVSTAELGAAGAALGVEIPLGATRRNITVSDIYLPREAGRRLRLGEVVVEITRDCAPCELMEETVGPGARAVLHERAGVRARILQGGIVRVGDPSELLPAD